MIDAHVHFWDTGAIDYPWLATVPHLARAFTPEAYALAVGAAPMEGIVAVEANPRPDQAELEVTRLEAYAEAGVPILGIVAFVDLLAPDVGARLDALAERPLVRGVRHNVQGNLPGFASADAFVAGVNAVGRRGLAFDVCATHDQLGEVETLVERCSGVRLVLDHCGKPPIAKGDPRAWRDAIARLSRFSNLRCKLSGLVSEAGRGRWSHDDLLPYASHVVEAFGRERVMYGSDWPVLTARATYADWRDFTGRVTAGWTDDERAAFEGGTAREHYQL